MTSVRNQGMVTTLYLLVTSSYAQHLLCCFPISKRRRRLPSRLLPSFTTPLYSKHHCPGRLFWRLAFPPHNAINSLLVNYKTASNINMARSAAGHYILCRGENCHFAATGGHRRRRIQGDGAVGRECAGASGAPGNLPRLLVAGTCTLPELPVLFRTSFAR